MKFAWKIFICTAVLMTLLLGFGNYILLSTEFDLLLKQQIDLALHDNAMQKVAIETTVQNNYSFLEGAELTDSTIVGIAYSVYINTGEKTIFRISDENKKILFCSKSYPFSNAWIPQMEKDEMKFYFDRYNGKEYLLCVSFSEINGKKLYFENIVDITDLFTVINTQTQTFQKINIIFLLFSSAILFVISVFLTYPLKKLTKITKRISNGEYHLRAKTKSNDEIGMFVNDFNQMTENLEEKIKTLEDDAKQKERFISDFSHELKTPMTSIIGYADMIRSNKMSEENLMKSANYIFSEGKRLETLSLKLLELNSLTNKQVSFEKTNTVRFIEKIAFFVKPNLTKEKIKFLYHAEPADIYIEPDLMSDMLINLIDNAKKAIENNGCITLIGKKENDGYTFYVNDNGRGIEKDQIDKITQAFYMVDKSRSRAQNGAGLGLSLCERIAYVHNSKLEIDSEVGKGTSIRIFIKDTEVLRNENIKNQE